MWEFFTSSTFEEAAMFDKWERLKELVGRLVGERSPRRPLRRARLQIEALEERWCPAADVWVWVGPAVVNSNWSNPGDAQGRSFWQKNGNPSLLGDYPGKNATNDVVVFSQNSAGPATLDVANVAIGSLQFTGWLDTLTLAQTLFVSDPNGNFILSDGSTISMNNGTGLVLLNEGTAVPGTAPVNLWTGGTLSAERIPDSFSPVRSWIFRGSLETWERI
jgi:hypothetical protein